jgi:hypothetical protein
VKIEATVFEANVTQTETIFLVRGNANAEVPKVAFNAMPQLTGRVEDELRDLRLHAG